jgi:hypothetical protein
LGIFPNTEVLSNLSPEIFWPSPRKGHVKSFSKLLPERASFEDFWSEALKLYTEDSKTDDRGGGPLQMLLWDFKKSQPVSMAGFYFKGYSLRESIPSSKISFQSPYTQ